MINPYNAFDLVDDHDEDELQKPPDRRTWKNWALNMHGRSGKVDFEISYPQYTMPERKTRYEVNAMDLYTTLIVPTTHSHSALRDLPTVTRWDVEHLRLVAGTCWNADQFNSALTDRVLVDMALSGVRGRLTGVTASAIERLVANFFGRYTYLVTRSPDTQELVLHRTIPSYDPDAEHTGYAILLDLHLNDLQLDLAANFNLDEAPPQKLCIDALRVALHDTG